jgi:hypothetical protein
VFVWNFSPKWQYVWLPYNYFVEVDFGGNFAKKLLITIYPKSFRMKCNFVKSTPDASLAP